MIGLEVAMLPNILTPYIIYLMVLIVSFKFDVPNRILKFFGD